MINMKIKVAYLNKKEKKNYKKNSKYRGICSCKRRGMEGGGRIYIFNSLVTTFLSKISYDIF